MGNKDFQDDDVTKIHWEKFNMIGRFIDSISQCQQACREINCREDTARENQGYTEEEDSKVRELLLLNRRSLLLEDDVRSLNLDHRIFADSISRRFSHSALKWMQSPRMSKALKNMKLTIVHDPLPREQLLEMASRI